MNIGVIAFAVVCCIIGGGFITYALRGYKPARAQIRSIGRTIDLIRADLGRRPPGE